MEKRVFSLNWKLRGSRHSTEDMRLHFGKDLKIIEPLHNRLKPEQIRTILLIAVVVSPLAIAAAEMLAK